MAINYGVAFTVNNVTYHSKDDYNLIMTNKQISTPVPETHYVEVPGRNGAIDMSDIITGTTKFKPRTITLSFFSPKHVAEWELEATTIRNQICGRSCNIVFDDDLAFKWIGRVTSVECAYEGRNETIQIVAEVDPFKRNVTSSAEPWLWDPFDFDLGIINETADVPISGSGTITITASQQWTNPTVSVTADMTMVFRNSANETTTKTLYAADGSVVLYDCIIKEGDNTFTFTGTGNVTINYVGGML